MRGHGGHHGHDGLLRAADNARLMTPPQIRPISPFIIGFESESEEEDAAGPGILSQLRGALYSKESNEKGDSTERRVPLGVKGQNLPRIPQLQ